MIENLTDYEILQGLKRYDEKVTSEFFYDTCRIAYCVDDKKYGLRYKTGMDFFSLAHEYYLRLCNNEWRQLEKRKPNITLANWTMNGFHYLVRERLNTYSHSHFEESIEERASRGQVVFDAPVDDCQAEVKEMVEEICHAYYGYDRKAQSILRMILIMGMKGKEVASLIGITPAAVSQRYHTMMDQVLRPYFMKYYAQSSISYSKASVQKEQSRSAYHMHSKGKLCIPSEEKLNLDQRSFGGKAFDSFRKGISFGLKKLCMDNTQRHATPSIIHTLHNHEIFVFGSDLQGVHCGGTAYQALRSFGAQLGKGVGPQGQCYAIPTIVGGLRKIQPYVDEFFNYVACHPQQRFLVTPVGCGIAGFTPEDIAPMFTLATEFDNISLPQEFWDVIDRIR